MKLRDWFRSRKEKREERRRERLARRHGGEPEAGAQPERAVGTEPDEPAEPERKIPSEQGTPSEPAQYFEAFTEGIEPPASRYTEEYREFIAKERQAADGDGPVTREER